MAGAGTGDRGTGLSSASRRWRRSTASTSRSPTAPCTACSARTAPARPRRCGCYHAARRRRRRARTSPGSTSPRDPQEVRRRIGLAGQYAAVDEILTGRQNLELFGGCSTSAGAGPSVRATELLERFDLADAADKGVKSTAAACGAGSTWPPSMILAPAGAVPRRADDRARPARPQRGLGRDPGPGDRRHHGAAHHAVPRGGRPALRPDHRHRPRPHGRHRLACGAEGRCRRGPDRGGGRSRGRPGPGGRGVRRRVASEPEVVTELRTVTAPVADRVGRPDARSRAGSRPDGVAVEDISLRRPTLDDVFLRLTGHRADEPDQTDRPTPPIGQPRRPSDDHHNRPSTTDLAPSGARRRGGRCPTAPRWCGADCSTTAASRA